MAQGNGKGGNGRTVRTPKKRAVFLKALAETGTVTHACRAAKLPRQTAYDWRAADPEFAKQWTDAIDVVADRIENALLTLALKCADDNHPPKATTAAIFLLKGLRPEKFRERHDHRVSGKLEVTQPKTEEELAEKIDSLPPSVAARMGAFLGGEDG
jgi:hypothetical protein